MSVDKFVAKLRKHEAAINDMSDPFDDGIACTSPSVNFIFGKKWKLPYGYGEILYGTGKGGKSWLAKLRIAWLHQNDPEAIAIVFDTEGRWRLQLTPKNAKDLGIDLNRLIIYQTNDPVEIFDFMYSDINAMCQEGAKIKYIVIDSVSQIRGRRDMNADTLGTQQIGDEAATLKDGFKRILKVQRRNKIAITAIAHARAEMDPMEVKRTGRSFRMQAGYALQHWGEFFIIVSANKTKDGRTDLMGNEMINEEMTDLTDKGERQGHKIRVTMDNASVGPKNRTGEFTIDYNKGLVNVHEEVWRLGYNRKVIGRKGTWYTFGTRQWQGKEPMLAEMVENPALQQAIIADLMAQDSNENSLDSDVETDIVQSEDET